jgi:hypothetical protein
VVVDTWYISAMMKWLLWTRINKRT